MENRDDRPEPFRPKMPFHMVWLATNACNARCRHCSSSSTTRCADELTTREACGLIDELAEAGVFDLAVSGGEPLLRKDLFQILEHARRRGMSVGVGSNGGKVTLSQLRRLKDVGINRFQVSLDGLPDQHDWLRRWPGLFERVQDTLALARDAGLPTHVCCTINRHNAATLETFADLVSATGVKRLNFSRYVPTGRGTDALDLPDDEWKSIARRCIDLRERHRGRLEIVTHLAQQILVDPDVQDMPGFIGCQAGIGQGCVTATGDVLPCVLLPVPMGNVRQRRFAEIWCDSPVTKALRARSLEDPCGTCKVTDRCAGCRAVAFAKTGNYLAADPRCWITTIRLPDKTRRQDHEDRTSIERS